MTQTARAVRYTTFTMLALAVNGMTLLFRSPGRDDAIRAALFFDCLITIPLCYWLLLVRPGLRGKASLALIAQSASCAASTC